MLPATTRTLLRPFDRLTRQHTVATPHAVSGRRWAHSVLATIASSRPYGALVSVERARIDLLPFQLEPALAMLKHGHTRVLLADEVGLGKTIQAGILLGELSRRSDAFRALVLVPAGLREQWSAELSDRFGLDAIATDAAWLASRSRDLPQDVNPWTLPGIYLASVDLIKRPEVLRAIEDVSWDVFVLDEAHAGAVGTARLAAAAAIGRRSRRVLLLTATPPDGDPAQMAALTDIGRLGGDDPLIEFRRTRSDAGMSGGRRTVMLQIRLSAAEEHMHRVLESYTQRLWTEAGQRKDPRARLVSVMLRKRALSCGWSLAQTVMRRATLLDTGMPTPPESQLLLPLGDDDVVDDEVSEAVLGTAGLSDGATERALLEEIAAAATSGASNETKTAFLLRLLRRAHEPAIVFTEYRDTLLHLEQALRADGFDPLLLHGGMPAAERSRVQRVYNERGVVLLATDAASEGLNLHGRCRLVIHFELPWTPARLEQRTGRVDRLGQRRRVHEVLLVSRHNAERLVLAPLIRRAQTARQRTGTGRGAAALLTESQIAEVLMGCAPPDSEPSGTPEAHATLDVRTAARVEAERIASRRRIQSTGNREPRVIVSSSRKARGVTLVYQARLEAPSGELVHSSPVALRISTRGPGSRRFSDIRAWLEAFDCHEGLRCRSQAEAAAREELNIALTLHAATHARTAARERALAQRFPSTAQQLVQAGLFDTRALRQSTYRQRAATLLSDESDARSVDSRLGAELQVRVSLVAARFGTGGEG